MPSARAISMMDVHIGDLLLLRQVLAEEGVHLAPAIHALLDAVERPVPIEEAVAGPVVAVELVVLAELLELGFVLVHLLGAGRAVVVAEQAEQRALEVLGHVDRRHRRLGVELLLAHDHAAAPQVDAGIDVLLLAGIDEGVAAAGAGAEYADLAVVTGLGTHPLHEAAVSPTIWESAMPPSART